MVERHEQNMNSPFTEDDLHVANQYTERCSTSLASSYFRLWFCFSSKCCPNKFLTFQVEKRKSNVLRYRKLCIHQWK